jgi:excisionase family DNA binding protein
MTTTEAAAALSLARRRIVQLIASGRLPATKHGRDWLITEDAVAAFAKRTPGRPSSGKGEGDGPAQAEAEGGEG